MSFNSDSRCSPFFLMMATASRKSSWPASARLPAKTSAKPRIAVMGVRISWLMLARKLLFATVAAWAMV